MSEYQHQLQDDVESTLRAVEDSRTGMDVFEAGLVENIEIDDGAVTVEADLGRFDPRTSSEVMETMLRAVRNVSGVETAHVEPAGVDADDRVSIAEIDTVVAVASTKGGVGKSTVATQLACAMAADRDVGLFDADIFGPNVPSLLDVDDTIMADDEDNPIPTTVDGMELMSVGLMTEGGPLAWRGAMAHDALSDLFADAAWDDPDTLVIDLPPGTSDVLLTTLQEVPIDGVVFVTTPFHTSVEDTRRSRRLFEENGVPVLGAVLNMERFVCDDCGENHDMFPGQSPAEGLEMPVLAELPFSPDLQAEPSPGSAPEAFEALAETVAERLADADRLELPGDPVDIRGLEAQQRVDRVRESFESLGSGDPLYLVSDRDPTPVGEFLTDLTGREGDPTEALPEFAVERRGLEKWALKAVRP
ncbi:MULTISPECIES: P-loop NTPase [Halorussus]|uniref:P-loop NTPase n=1 Tax=Halorussus TaxID=1070314 RepID=UPI000E20DB7C|nr:MULTISPECIES: P-loop NTPase [Halorussus]NHN61590.1 P-loop NTPase [Halorussus sp. JP-T4]